MTTELDMDAVAHRAKSGHAALQHHFATLAAANQALTADTDTSYSTTSATGSCAYVFVYLQVDCLMKFADGTNLQFNGKGMVAGLGATGSLGGSCTFNMPPSSLIGASGITFEASSIGIVAGGFQVTWYKDHRYIGHGEFVGVGVQLGTPGGGWGSFS